MVMIEAIVPTGIDFPGFSSTPDMFAPVKMAVIDGYTTATSDQLMAKIDPANRL